MSINSTIWIRFLCFIGWHEWSWKAEIVEDEDGRRCIAGLDIGPPHHATCTRCGTRHG